MDESLIRSISNAYAEILRNIVNGYEVQYVGGSWDEVYAGNVNFESQGWKFTIFNDCDSLDYSDSATSPDGVTIDFDMMFDNQCDPVLFNGFDTEDEALEKALKRATKKPVEESK